MALGNRKDQSQSSMWVSTQDLVKSSGHPFYQKLNEILKQHDFDPHAESKCANAKEPPGMQQPVRVKSH